MLFSCLQQCLFVVRKSCVNPHLEPYVLVSFVIIVSSRMNAQDTCTQRLFNFCLEGRKQQKFYGALEYSTLRSSIENLFLMLQSIHQLLRRMSN